MRFGQEPLVSVNFLASSMLVVLLNAFAISKRLSLALVFVQKDWLVVLVMKVPP